MRAPQAAYLLTSQGKDKGKHAADAHHGKAAKAHAPSEELVKEPAPKEEEPTPAEVRFSATASLLPTSP